MVIQYLSTSSFTILHMDIPDLDSLREAVEYWQNQIFSIDQSMQEDGLYKDDKDLTPEQRTLKQADIEARKECEANRKGAMKDYSEAGSKGGNNSSSMAGQKRSANNYEAGPSKK